MKLALIAPATQENLEKPGKGICPPLSLATVAALTPPDIDISILDDNVTPLDFNIQPDLVGITTLTITAPRAYQIADAFRSKGIKVILGGSHASALPGEALQHADSVVIGEAEGLWPKVIEDFQSHRLQPTYQLSERPNLVNLPVPRRDLYPEKAYYITNTIFTTRGCPNACSFCSVTSFFGHTYRCRPVEEVIREIESFKRGSFMGFVDDNLFANRRFAKELFRSMIPFKLKWIAQASVDLARDEELLDLASRSGCLAVFIGFETISQTNLKSVSKRINHVDEYINVVNKIHAHGIAVHGLFVLGFDEDDESVFLRTAHFARDMHLDTASFTWLVPYPGTGICESLGSSGRILTRDWSRYESAPVFQPSHMSPEALRRGHLMTFREFYAIPSIFQRIGLVHRRLIMFWGANLALRRAWKSRRI